MNKPNKGQVLIVDDDDDVRDLLRDIVESDGFDVMECADALAVIGSLRENAPETIVLDLQMPGLDGIEVLRRLNEVNCTARIIIVSGSDPRILSSAVRMGRDLGLHVVGGLGKPIDFGKFSRLLVHPVDDSTRLTKQQALNALDNGALATHFQPTLDLQHQCGPKPTGAEALVRWLDDEQGLIMPDRFLPAISEEKAMLKLTYWVVNHVTEQLGRWHRNGLDLSVAINLDTQMLDDLNLPDKLVDIADSNQAPTEKITLEITENARIADTRNAMDILMRLRLKGFELSIDDFGTGFSSLTELYKLPFSELKVDRSFVSEACQNKEARTIVRSVVDLAHNLGLRACAEGVEDELTLDFLLDIGCDRAQGYLFSEALPVEDFESFIERSAMAA